MDPVYCMPPGAFFVPSGMEGAIPVNGGFMIPQPQAYAMPPPPPGTMSMPMTAVPHRPHGGMLNQYEYDCLVYQMGRLNTSSRGHMPDWLFDEEGKIAVSLQEVVEHDLFFVFLRDKKGSHYSSSKTTSRPKTALSVVSFSTWSSIRIPSTTLPWTCSATLSFRK
uniref:SH2 domain-containing protein n=1 Tax=Panagrellus redivivus TaxID=6233 RepID=A0A7E4VF12_PANRE